MNRKEFLKTSLALEVVANLGWTSCLNPALTNKARTVIAIGDQVYWDLGEIVPGIPGEGDNEMAFKKAGKFDENLAILGTPNETVLKKAIDPQIVDVYGTMCRSTPVLC